ncbi:putative thioredoxin [Morganella phage vB_MmoM_Rgz1]|nr:putative thioredoxin [Morganella phage vB_MmoM_Rgz1]
MLERFLPLVNNMNLNVLKPTDYIPNWPEVITMVQRREDVSKRIPRCPECASEQVQLVSWYTDQLQCKCRCCNHKFDIQFVRPKDLQ